MIDLKTETFIEIVALTNESPLFNLDMKLLYLGLERDYLLPIRLNLFLFVYDLLLLIIYQ